MSEAKLTGSPRMLVAVTAFNRPQALGRLLDSLGLLHSVGCSFDLLISIDGGGDPVCETIARGFEWKHGALEVRVHERKLGLKKHIETTTGQVRDYDAVVVLEDDLSVSPWMLHYCLKSYEQYGDCEDIAQISLYRQSVNECGFPFSPLDCGSDVWFARVPSSWGQMYTRKQWLQYVEWAKNSEDDSPTMDMPPVVDSWRHTWKRGFFKYVSTNRLWVVYPHRSLTTNHGDAGTNYANDIHDLQVPLEMIRRDYRWCMPAETKSRYDEWLEPLPDTFDLELPIGETLKIDLWGQKPLDRLQGGMLLSLRPCKKPIMRFAVSLVPLEMNVRLKRKADGDESIALGRVEDFTGNGPAVDIAIRGIQRGLLKEAVARRRRRSRVRRMFGACFKPKSA